MTVVVVMSVVVVVIIVIPSDSWIISSVIDYSIISSIVGVQRPMVSVVQSTALESLTIAETINVKVKIKKRVLI